MIFNKSEYTRCLTVDCPMTYFCNADDEAEFFCEQCLQSWCIKCKVPYHYGKTCDEFQKSEGQEKKEKDEEGIQELMQVLGIQKCT